MSLQLLRQTVRSPFQLQRSMVDQGGAGGAYESGEFTGKSQYSDGGMAAAISSFGASISAGIDAISDKDMNKMNEKKADRLAVRGAKTEAKKQKAIESGDLSKADRMTKRGERVEARLGATNKKIEEYKQSKNPTLESDVKPVKPKTETPKTETPEETEAVSKMPATKPVSSIEGGSTNSLSFKGKLQDITDFNSPIGQKKNKRY
jgi:hypothetical protein